MIQRSQTRQDPRGAVTSMGYSLGEVGALAQLVADDERRQLGASCPCYWVKNSSMEYIGRLATDEVKT